MPIVSSSVSPAFTNAFLAAFIHGTENPPSLYPTPIESTPPPPTLLMAILATAAARADYMVLRPRYKESSMPIWSRQTYRRQLGRQRSRPTEMIFEICVFRFKY